MNNGDRMTATERKPIGKKTRFEIFKRDGFACQYCGSSPPSVVLEVDHIDPVANGGSNLQDNLVTACFNCNRGKSSRLLAVVPMSLAAKAAEISEREEQLRGYSQILEAKRIRLDEETWIVLAEMISEKTTTAPREQFDSTRMFIERLGFHVVLESMQIAMGSAASYRNTFKYFCGVCWNRIRESSQ